MKKFVVYSHPRSKTNLFVTYLNNHPAIFAHGEAFNHLDNSFSLKQVGIDKSDYSLGNKKNSLALLNTFYARPQNEQTKAIGFKFFPFHNDFIFSAIHQDASIHKLILIRNFLYSYTSEKIAKQTGQYLISGDEQPKRIKVKFDFAEFEHYYNRLHKDYLQSISFFQKNNHPYHIIFAEDLHEIDTMNQVYDFLALPLLHTNPTSRLKPQNTSSLQGRLTNYQEAVDQLRNTKYEPLLEKDYVPNQAYWRSNKISLVNDAKGVDFQLRLNAFNQFVLLTNTRTKSNLLISQLEQHEAVDCHGEVFTKKQIHTSGKGIAPEKLGLKHENDLVGRDANPVLFTRRLLSSPLTEKTQAIGFKLMPLSQSPGVLEFVKKEKRIKKIILVRNMLYSFTSFKIAKKTQQWILKEEQNKVSAKIDFDLSHFLNYAEKVENLYQDLIAELASKKQEYKVVFAEDLLDLDTFNEILEFIGVEPVTTIPNSVIYPQNPIDLRDRVRNYEEMVAGLSTTKYKSLLDGDYVPDRSTYLSPRSSLEKFVVISEPRSKTQLLISLLDKHPELLLHGELFKDGAIGLRNEVPRTAVTPYNNPKVAVRYRDDFPIRFLHNVFAHCTNEEVQKMGFKIFGDHSEKALNYCLDHSDFQKIILIRNPLYRFLSLESAHKSQQWILKDKSKQRFQPIEYDHQKFLKFNQKSMRYFRRVIEHLQQTEQQYLVVYANDLPAKTEYDRIFKFLGLSKFKGNLDPITFRQNPEPLQKRVVNYHQMVTALKNDGMEAFLKESFIPFRDTLFQKQELSQPVDWEKRLEKAVRGEDLYEIPNRLLFPKIEASLKLIHGPARAKTYKKEVLGFCLVKNGAAYLEQHLKHHLALGVKHLYYLDNGSTDGSIELLKQHSNVTVYQSHLNFRKYEKVMREYMVTTFGKSRWCLVVDADELFYPPMDKFLSLADFIRYLERNRFTGVVAQMLDVFPKGKLLGDKINRPGEVEEYYDISTIDRYYYYGVTGAKAPSSVKFYKGGIRKKIFGLNDVYLTKTPLFFCEMPFKYKHIHYAHLLALADVTALLKHYKFFGDFSSKTKAAVAQEIHVENNQLLKTLEENPNLSLHSDTAHLWGGTPDLVKSSFLISSVPYLRYVLSVIEKKLEREKDEEKRRLIESDKQQLLKHLFLFLKKKDKVIASLIKKNELLRTEIKKITLSKKESPVATPTTLQKEIFSPKSLLAKLKDWLTK